MTASNTLANIHHRAARALAVLAVVLLAGPAWADNFAADRQKMVDEEIVAAGVKDPRVIQSMRDTPRHEFVPLNLRKNAYFDMALAIGDQQTISPPFVVAYMTEQLMPQPTDKVLEIGTGSGYQAAVLSPLVKEVYTIEIKEQLGQRAARALKRLKYANVFPKVGDGYKGWPEHAPFDKIIVTCSPEKVPQPLVDQLREGGRMIVPVGERYQQMLYLLEKRDGKMAQVALLPTLFVPMTGQAEDGRLVKPDPAHPSIHNGGFEQLAADKSDSAPQDSGAKNNPPADSPEEKPLGWHYQRQLKLETAADAPQGTRFVTFSNTEPGRSAQALQGMPVDGRKVKKLDVSLWVKANDVRPGANESQQPVLSVMFYDDNRAETGYTFVGPWRDSFDWKQVKETLRVPPKAREAVVRIGLSGATGEISFDGIRIKAAE